jgi:hypothetical protein
MSEQDANKLIGCKVESLHTGNRFVVRDVLHGAYLWLSGGQMIPFDAFDMFWRAVTQ